MRNRFYLSARGNDGLRWIVRDGMRGGAEVTRWATPDYAKQDAAMKNARVAEDDIDRAMDWIAEGRRLLELST